MTSDKLENKKLIIVVNVDTFFLSHRLPIAKEALKRGWKVVLITKDTGKKQLIESMGITLIDLPISRAGMNPIHELKCIHKLQKEFKRIKPNIIHLVGLKASLLGSIAARLSKMKKVVNAITGLGYVFTDDKKYLLKNIILLLLKLTFKNSSYSFIVQNSDDLHFINSLNLVPKRNVFLIKSSGVDTEVFKKTELVPKNKISVVLPARMLKDKGIIEFINAAKTLKNEYLSKVEFLLYGGIDLENKAGIKEEELIEMLQEDYIIWKGFQTNMYEAYKYADLVVLPSYREGFPKCLIEAMAVGRAIITTNVPGCKEAVIDGYNGYLVNPKDHIDLAKKIKHSISNRELLVKFGENSHKLAIEHYTIEKIVEETFKAYNY